MTHSVKIDKKQQRFCFIFYEKTVEIFFRLRYNISNDCLRQYADRVFLAEEL